MDLCSLPGAINLLTMVRNSERLGRPVKVSYRA